MSKNCVAILDVRSSKISAIIGQRGVNNTFILKSIKTLFYEGFGDGVFFDESQLENVITETLNFVQASSKIKIKELFVGVPGEFIVPITINHSLSFQSKKKITKQDIQNLILSGFVNTYKNYTVIKTAPVYYILGDKRRTIYPEGLVSEIIEGNLTYFLCENKFISLFNKILNSFGIDIINFLPTTLAEINYLIPSEIRDEIAVFVDNDYISTNVCVVQGNSIIHQKSFSRGLGCIIAYLSEAFDIDFNLAEQLLRKVNLSCAYTDKDYYEINFEDDNKRFISKNINEVIEYGLDEICELITISLESYKGKTLENKTLLFTGCGLNSIRGAFEYMTKRLNFVIESIAPNLPHLNKPSESSFLSVLDMALTDNKQKVSIFKKIFN